MYSYSKVGVADAVLLVVVLLLLAMVLEAVVVLLLAMVLILVLPVLVLLVLVIVVALVLVVLVLVVLMLVGRAVIPVLLLPVGPPGFEEVPDCDVVTADVLVPLNSIGQEGEDDKCQVTLALLYVSDDWTVWVV